MFNINRLKKSYHETPWSFENTHCPRQKTKQLDTEDFLDEDVEIQSRPIATAYERETQVSKRKPLGRKNNS